MTQRANILEELKKLNSSLPASTLQADYTVPSGYFDQLAEQVLNRINAMEAATAADEINHLSPLLAGVSKQMPYSIPADYFKELDIHSGLQAHSSAKEELESISPLLSSLKKEMPYTVPAGYFENVELPSQQKGKLLFLTSRKWFRYAAAAVMAGAIATTVFFIKASQDPEKVLARFEKKLDKEIKTTSDADLKEFIESASTEQDLAVLTPADEAKDLLKDIPVSDLQEFLDEVGDPAAIVDEKTSTE